MPESIDPMLAMLGELPTDVDQWSFEYKWDGVRAISFWDGARLTLHSRNQLDITRRYPELHALGKALPGRGTILDGEILALDDTGKPSFALLQRRMHAEGAENIARLVKEVPIWYVLFDVLWANGMSLLDRTYTQRREILEGLTIAGPAWQITPAHIGQGKAMLDAARQNGMEGLVAKRLDSVYELGRRSPNWRKMKVVFGQEFVIGGWVPEKGVHHDRVGTLLGGYFDCQGRLHFAGGIGTGFNAAIHAKLTKKLAARKISYSPFVERIPKKDIVFVKPDLVAEVEYRRWPVGGQIQQASFKGLRTDKSAREVIKEGQGCSPTYVR
jgi:bifunctional non-homologous end joining protein LigD